MSALFKYVHLKRNAICDTLFDVTFIQLLSKLLPSQIAYAHCDIPCKIYDPHQAQVAAHSVIRMTQMLIEAETTEDGIKREHHVARLTKVKEEHAEIVKHEIRVIWGDYFKEEQIQKVPEISNLVHEIMMTASKTKQEVNLEETKKLLSLVQEFAEKFFLTKGFEIMRIPSGFPTEGEIVIHK